MKLFKMFLYLLGGGALKSQKKNFSLLIMQVSRIELRSSGLVISLLSLAIFLVPKTVSSYYHILRTSNLQTELETLLISCCQIYLTMTSNVILFSWKWRLLSLIWTVVCLQTWTRRETILSWSHGQGIATVLWTMVVKMGE